MSEKTLVIELAPDVTLTLAGEAVARFETAVPVVVSAAPKEHEPCVRVAGRHDEPEHAPTQSSDRKEELQFGEAEQVAALELLEQQLWGDVDGFLYSMEFALRLALDATYDEFQDWEERVGPRLLDAYAAEENDLPAEAIDEFSPEEKLAFIARLIRNIAVGYGVSVDYLPPHVNVGQEDEHTPAAVIRGLNDIAWLSSFEESR
jgi:hypothetical protein